MIRGLCLMLACTVLAGRPLPAQEVDPQKAEKDSDGKTLWYDATLLGIEGKGWTTTASPYDRLPAKAKGVVRDAVWNLSLDSAGLCVRFTTDAESLRVKWTLRNGGLAMPHMPATGVSGVDLYTRDSEGRWHFIANGRPKAVENDARFNLRIKGEHLLYLPLYNGIKKLQLGIPKGSTLSRPVVRPPGRKTVVIYGTSITQGGCASRPGTAATAILGRALDVTVINLGFSGNGRMEPELSDLLAGLDPALYVLDCIWNMSEAQVAERVEPFVRKLRAARPDTPILLAEDSSVRDTTPTAKGRILRSVYDKLTSSGVKGLHFLSNQGMLGTDGEGTVDGVHPTDLGFMRQAGVFTKAMEPLLK